MFRYFTWGVNSFALSGVIPLLFNDQLTILVISGGHNLPLFKSDFLFE